MFVISQSDTYTWPVKVEVPTDGGKWENHTFDGVFKRIPQSRMEEIRKAAEGSIQDMDLARELLAGWAGVTDSEGNEVPFTEATRDRLLDIPAVATSIVRAFIASLQGAKRKN